MSSSADRFENVPATHAGDKTLRRRRRPHGIFRSFYHSLLKFVGKMHRP